MSIADAAVLLAMAMVVGLTVIAAMAVLVRYEPSSPSTYSSGSWYVELWNVADGARIVMRFHQMVVVGRLSLYNNTVSPFIPQVDGTVSREQCMLYEENGALYVWNMSFVNPTAFNDQPLRQPMRLIPGSRLRMGYSTFLVTQAEYV